jgi:class 3 adenylate cyclase/tetratricopeptide (TPR) repeat protein
MKCPKCHIENPDDNKFCRECGTSLALTCTECANELQAGDKFCGKCGQKVVVAAKEETTELTTKGERKHVTVLFSDLSGYTTLSEKLDPEEVKEITGRIFGEVSKIIAKYDGFVEKYAGDAVMALFGVNRSREGDPVRAVMSAREIHDAVETLNPEYEQKIGQPLSMHSGINTGLVVTGEVDVERGTHGVAGDTINVAARLSTAAKAGDILIDHETFKRTEGYFQFEDLEPVQLKGKKNAVQIHRYLDIKDQPQKVHRLHGLRAELIGRKAEMAQLSGAVDNLKKGKGGVFSIVGTAGTGKSRLVEEFKASLDLKETQWLEGHAFPYAQNIPYIPLIDLVSKAIQIDEGDTPDAVKEKLESGLKVLIGETQGVVPYIGSLYALDYPEIEDVSPEFWKAELQKAVLKVLTALAQRAPTIICLEDLHWADPSTTELVHFLLSEIRHPVQFLCVYRPIISLFSSHQVKGMALPHHELNLQDLSLSEAQNMVESLLKTDAVPGDLQQFIRNKVEGNPFYLEEAVNSLIESKALIPENGNWKVVGPITESEISATIQGVISARVDRLEHESKRILQEASVIGRSFYHEILKRISEIKDNIDKSLRGLERFDLIKTKSIQPYLEYIFKHALTQEVVYNGLLKKERREIHDRIGYVIEELFKDRLPEFYETLAFHFKNGRSIDKAIHYLMRSGEKSLKRYSVHESHQSYLEAFEILTAIEDKSNEDRKLIVKLIVDWALVYYYRGDFKGLNELLEAHEAIAESLDDRATLGMFYAWFGLVLYFRARSRESYQYLKKALEIGQGLGDTRITGYASAWLASPSTDIGLFEEAIKHATRAHELAKKIPEDQYLYFKSLWGSVYAYQSMGYGKNCSRIGEKILDYGSRHSNIRCQVVGHICIGIGFNKTGHYSAAVKSLEQGAAIAVDPFYSQWAKLFLSINYLANDQIKEAENTLKEIRTYSTEFGCELFDLLTKALLGIISIIRGRMSEGIKMFQETNRDGYEEGRDGWFAAWEYMFGNIYLQIARGGEKPDLSFLLKNIGFLVKNAPRADQKAQTHYNLAIEHAMKVGDRGTLGRCYLDLGILHRAKKRFDKAKECFQKAFEIFEETEADGYLKQTKEALESLR